MSAADDVMEMQSLCGFIADKLAGSKKDKDRATAIYDAFSAMKADVSWNRCFEFLKGKVRIVQSWEKDLARQQADAIRQAEHERKTGEHISWLRSVYERAAARGADVDRSEIAVLQRALSQVGAFDSALGNTGATFGRRSTDEGR